MNLTQDLSIIELVVNASLVVKLIMALLATMVILPLIRGDSSGVRIALTGAQEVPDARPVMKNPRFQGADSKMQPYMVTAKSAIQQDADTIVLNTVQADLTLKDNTWLAVKAEQGTLKLSRQVLYLVGNVDVFHDGGYEMHTERAFVDMAARRWKAAAKWAILPRSPSRRMTVADGWCLTGR